MGLPLAAAPFGALFISGFSVCGPCGSSSPPVETTHVISMAQHDSLVVTPGTIDLTACAALCMELRRGDGGVSDGATRDGGMSVSDGNTWHCTLDRVEPNEVLTCISQQNSGGCVGGRRPQALVARRSGAADVAAWLAEVAHLEAASVPAFDELAIELSLHAAPARLSRVARQSADDERRHARIVRRLATRFGARPLPVRRGEIAPRSLTAIAKDNAVEGCVREAYGAVVAACQANDAADAEVRAAFAGIARDEARHALFSFALHDWASDRLGAQQAQRLDALRRAELARMQAELAEPSAAQRSILGLPDATRAGDLLALLAA